MTTSDTLETFFQALRRSQLLDAAQLNEVRLDLLPDVHDAQELSEHLIELGWLSEYQAEQLLQGHNRELVLGPYSLLDPVGEGGLCQVFRAWDSEAQRIVALKVVHPELRHNTDTLEQLRQEMAVLGRLDHPSFIKSYDRGGGGERFYFAMELAEGVDLHRLLKRVGRLPVAQACDWVRQAALGLQYAYEQGLVHRDVKPANLLAPFDGGPLRILDIGLARLEWDHKETTPAPSVTSVTSVMGTPDYIAPEQALNSQQADTRADIYSLGCTLYHLLTGGPPFPGKSLTKKLLDHQQTPPPSVRQVRPELPAALAAVVLKMMAKAPAERYQTPAGVAVALAPFCKGGEARVALDQFQTRRRSFTGQRRPTRRAPQAAATGTRPKSSAVVPVLPAGLAPGPAPASGERRAAPRRGGNPVSVLLAFRDPKAEPLPGWVLNRSSGGLGVLLEEPLEIGSLLTVRPAAATTTAPWIEVRVVHCTAHRSSWCVGLQFVQKVSWGDLRAFG